MLSKTYVNIECFANKPNIFSSYGSNAMKKIGFFFKRQFLDMLVTAGSIMTWQGLTIVYSRH